MNKNLMIAALVALPLGLSGCDKKAETSQTEAPRADATSGDMAGMAMPVGSKMGKGSGTVTAVDVASGKITLDHGAIPSVEWPAMKMGFSAKPELLKGLAVGDKVDFEVTVTGNAGEVTAIKKQ